MSKSFTLETLVRWKKGKCVPRGRKRKTNWNWSLFKINEGSQRIVKFSLSFFFSRFWIIICSLRTNEREWESSLDWGHGSTFFPCFSSPWEVKAVEKEVTGHYMFQTRASFFWFWYNELLPLSLLSFVLVFLTFHTSLVRVNDVRATLSLFFPSGVSCSFPSWSRRSSALMKSKLKRNMTR